MYSPIKFNLILTIKSKNVFVIRFHDYLEFIIMPKFELYSIIYFIYLIGEDWFKTV